MKNSEAIGSEQIRERDPQGKRKAAVSVPILSDILRGCIARSATTFRFSILGRTTRINET